MIGLLCTAGGARGAYQAGVLKRVGELPAFNDGASPFKVLAGASAGAINVAAMAAGTLEFSRATRLLADIWEGITLDDIVRTDPVAMGGIAARWIRDLSFGGIIGGGHAQALMDASPLEGFLTKHLDLEGIGRAIERGQLYAVAITATNYNSGKSYTFVQGREGHPLWTKSRKLAYSAKLNISHIRASCAIPLVFAPVLIESSFGDYYYGDGALRLVNPFGPPIRLGASKILAIAIRADKPASLNEGNENVAPKAPTLASVFGVALNAIFLDHLEADFEHLKRLNDVIQALPAESHATLKEPLRPVEAVVLKPSQDIGKLAEGYASKMPRTIRYLMEGLGSSRVESSDLMSYLLFDGAFTRALVDLGYKDASAQIDRIEGFLRGAPG